MGLGLNQAQVMHEGRFPVRGRVEGSGFKGVGV